MPIEGAHALLKRARSSDPAGRLTVAEVLLIAEALRDSGPIVYHPGGPLLASVYDGLFLALAILLDGRVVTADRKFFDKVKASPHQARGRWFVDPP